MDGTTESYTDQDGRVVPVIDNGSTIYRSEYFIKDHLGNVRLSFADLNNNGKIEYDNPASLEVMQVGTLWRSRACLGKNHYYPFGLNHLGPWYESVSPDNKYQFNSIEKVDELNINLDLAAFRSYDAAIGRWTQIAPLTESVMNESPYGFCFNNPIGFSDRLGLEGEQSGTYYNPSIGADGLTNEQWVNSSRPGANPGLAEVYKNDNVAKELAIKRHVKYMNDQINEFLSEGGVEISRELCGQTIRIQYGGVMTINSESFRLAQALHSSAYTQSTGVSGAFGGGIGFEIGYAQDNYSRGGWFFRLSGQLGFGGGISLFNHVDLYSTKGNIQLSNIAGSDVSHNIDIGPLGFSFGGDQPLMQEGLKAFTNIGNTYYSGGYSTGTLRDLRNLKLKAKASVGFRTEFGETFFF